MNPLLMQLKCKSCQGDLDPNTAVGGVVVCRFCGNTFTLPKNESNNEVLEALRDAERELERGHFEEAFQTYQRVSEENEDEPEAYFGMALANAKVQYLNSLREDEKTGEPKKCLQPICYDIIDKKFTDDRNYKKALELATPDQKKVYAEKGKEIDDIRKKFNELKSSGVGYDCFICTKVSEIDNKNRHTEDCYDAEQLYSSIKEAGFNPFFSEKVLKKGLGVDYEAYILYALYSSPCMIIVCSDEAYLRTPWVQNEYTRFLQMIKNEEKHLNSITFAFKNGNIIEKLPGVSGKIQGVAIDSFGAKDQIINFVSKFSEARNRIPDISRKEYGKVSATRKNVIEQQIQKRNLKIEKGGIVASSNNANIETIQNLLDDGEFKAAVSYTQKKLEDNPKFSAGYWFLNLADAKVKNTEQFIANKSKMSSFDNLEKAISTEPDANKRKVYYDVLYQRVKKHKYSNEYEEYISLPESDPKKIEELSDIMYEEVLRTKDENLFKTILKTVTNTDKYIKMNREFMAKVPEVYKLCYANILEVDKSDGEALYETFLINHSLEPNDLPKFLEDEKHFDLLEKEVYAYGFNEYATSELYDIVLSLVRSKEEYEKASKIFDFVLKVIPKEKDKLFVEYLQKFIDNLLRYDKSEDILNLKDFKRKLQFREENGYKDTRKKQNFNMAESYNDLLIQTDPHNHDAYFNKFLIKYRVTNLLELVGLIDVMGDDDDYMTAMTQYNEVKTEKKGKNRYLLLKEALKSYAALLTKPKEKEDVLNNFFPTKDEIFDCAERIKEEIKTYNSIEKDKASEERKKEVAALKAQIKNKYKAFCEKYKISKEDDVYKLKKDVSKDPILFEIKEIAEKLAKLKSEEELTKVNNIIGGQKTSAFRNTRRIIVNIFSVLFLLVTFAAGAAMLFISICGFMGYNSSFYIVSIGLFKNNLALILYMLVGIAAIVLDIFIFIKRHYYSALLLHIIPIVVCGVVVGLSYYYKQNTKSVYYDNTMIMKFEKKDDSYTLAAFATLKDFDGELVLPETYRDKPVISLGKKFNRGIRTKDITKLTIPKTYRYVDAKAFRGNDKILAIYYNSDTAEVYEKEFYKCSKLTEIYFRTNITIIGSNAFAKCTKLTKVYFGDGHLDYDGIYFTGGMQVGDSAFTKSGIEKVYFEDFTDAEDRSINDNTFKDCKNLTYAYIGDGIKQIYANAFSGCTSLETVDLTNCTTIYLISSNAFKKTTSLTSIYIPASVKSIDKGAFSKSGLQTAKFANPTSWRYGPDTFTRLFKETYFSLEDESEAASRLKSGDSFVHN